MFFFHLDWIKFQYILTVAWVCNDADIWLNSQMLTAIDSAAGVCYLPWYINQSARATVR